MNDNTKFLIELNKKYKTNIEKNNLIYNPRHNGRQICFNSSGCVLSEKGYCIMCNYGRNKIPMDLERLKKGLDEIFKDYTYTQEIDYRLFGCNGSIFDRKEFSKECFDFFIDYISKYNIKHICFETFYSTVTEEILKQLKSKLKNSHIEIELGFESSSEFIRENCYLKFINNKIFKEKVDLIHKYGYTCTANLMYGAPFCTLAEQNKDLLDSINWLLKINIDTIAIFPMIIKEDTLLSKIYDLGLAKSAHLYGLIDVIGKIPDDKLSKIVFSWYNESDSKLYYLKSLPYACDKCRNIITNFLTEFCKADLPTRIKMKHSLPLDLPCDCVLKYEQELQEKSSKTLEQRIDYCVKQLKKENK